ncbi:MAG: 1-deoxy-D-xylulose-5-phosphate reductoisomerase, partial [Spirochaetales bacterium]|nr:1-deoxy-D-xylulose-5-phosphate reductoisomerase [Spirochaetales bacterium]
KKADPATITSLILTASGGAFRDYPISKLDTVTWQDALAHPTWDMGTKITIDSASMANKGLEVIEACELFDIPEDKVQVVIHPQSCVHGMIATLDGSFYAQLSRPDMRIPIQNALSYPEMLDYPEEKLTFDNMTLDFKKPDFERYPCLTLAREAAGKGGPYCLAYNAANEVAVEAFITERIRFTQIPRVISSCLDGDWGNLLGSLEQILDLDQQVRTRATSMIQEMAK